MRAPAGSGHSSVGGASMQRRAVACTGALATTAIDDASTLDTLYGSAAIESLGGELSVACLVPVPSDAG